MADLESVIDGLYARPLAEFTPARDALAAELKKQGARKDAARIKALEKPSVSPWVVNQLQHHARPKLEAFVEAAGRLLEAQRLGSAEDFRSAQGEKRRALQAALGEVESRLRAAGHAPSPATLQRVERTLEALAARGWPAEAGPGRLTDDLELPGFDAFAGLAVSAASLAPGPQASEPRDPRAAIRERAAALERAESEVKGAQDALRGAMRDAAQAAAAADGARKEQALAQEELQQASQRARDATERAERASFEARRNATALSEAERRVAAALAARDRLRRLP